MATSPVHEPASKTRRLDDNKAPAGDIDERVHFLDVSYSIADYERQALWRVEMFERRQRQALDDLLGERIMTKSALNELVEHMRIRVRLNQQNLMNKLVEDLGNNMVGPPEGLGKLRPPPGILRLPPGYRVKADNTSKAFSTIKQFVRDWSREGAANRDKCYGPLLQALEKYVPLEGSDADDLPKVLTPGSGLGRLTFEVARRGYHGEGSEFSYHMLLGTMWVLNQVQEELSTAIFPCVLDTSCRNRPHEHLNEVLIPDLCPNDYCDPDCGFGNISMRAGEFCEIYKEDSGNVDAILSAFFVDTANNVFHYIRTFARLVRPGGLWANMGPLLWHYSAEGGGSFDSVSIELAWDEVRPAIERYFEVREIERRDALYTEGMSKRKLYHCLYFTAIRNGVPVTGKSAPIV